MADMTTYLEDAIYNHVLRNTSYTSPTTVYLALFTADPTDAGTQTDELSSHVNYSSGYARAAMAMDAPSSGSGSNSAEESFGPVTLTGNITLTHVGIMDASSGGNMLFSDAMSATKEISNGDLIKYAAGNVTVEVD